MRTLINAAVTMMILDYKIKAKSRILTEAFDETFNKNHMIHMIPDDSSDEIIVDQKTFFSPKNTIITEKITFVLIVII